MLNVPQGRCQVGRDVGWGGGGRQGIVKELGRNQLQLRTLGLDAFGSHWAPLTFHLDKRRSTICAALM